MNTVRKRHHRSSQFKAQVALEAVQGEQTLNDIAIQFGVHPVQVAQWKSLLIARAAEAFNGPAARNAIKLKCQIEQERRHQLIRNEESWMLDVLHGHIPTETLIDDLAAGLPRSDAEHLYWCVKNHSTHYRTRAMSLLATKKGIRKSTIWHFLRVGSHYSERVVGHYKAEGIRWFSKHGRAGLRKHELEEYQEAVFAILHSPPSAHGINRTTWRRRDIKKVMSNHHLAIGKNGIDKIVRNAGYKFCKAKVFLTSNDPNYDRKVQGIINILANLKPDEKFFSIDEFGPFAVKMQGGKSFMRPTEVKVVPQFQKSKGVLIVTAALELSENQVTHFYSPHKNTEEMLKLLDVLIEKYSDQSCIYISWDAASWHASKELFVRVDEINSTCYRAAHKCPSVQLAPLPSRAQFLNVIESVFSGMAKAVIHNSDYQSVDQAVSAIDTYFSERNQQFRDHPKRAGGKIWGSEVVPPEFNQANNCKDQRYMNKR